MSCMSLTGSYKPVLLHAMKSILLFLLHEQLAISKEDLISSRLWNLLFREEGV